MIMQTKTMRILCALLAALILTSCAGGTEKETTGDTTADTAVQTEAETEPDPAAARRAISDDLPDTDMDGYTYRVLSRQRDDFVNDIGLDLEQNGDVVNDAIYSRNLTVTERFNCKMDATFTDNFDATGINTITAGDDAYDIMFWQIVQIPKYATTGYFRDWYEDLPHVHLDKPWYIGNAAEALSVKGHAYAMIGEYDLDVLRFTYCMYYNQDIANEYNLEDIYDVVDSGRWTYDKMYEYANMVYVDLDGNGAKDENDRLGLSGDPYSAVVTYQYAFDNPLFTIDDEGVPKFTMDREKLASIVEKLNALYHGSLGGYTEGWGTGWTAWSAGNLLLYTGLFQSATGYRDLEFDYGIIPYPKYDEAQTRYYTMSDGAHGCMLIPITVQNIEWSSMLTEALNAETYKQVVPAYFDTALKVKLSRDAESAAMLDLLMDVRVFDFGYMYNTGIAFIIQDMVSKNANNTESSFNSKIGAAEKQWDKIIDTYLELAEAKEG